jgi:hypothetical protein
MMIPDPAEAWLLQIEQEAQSRGLRMDPRYIEMFGALCPVCGQMTNRRDPYPGVVMRSWLDPKAGVVIPHWACSDCGQLDARELDDRLRLRFSEFLME